MRMIWWVKCGVQGRKFSNIGTGEALPLYRGPRSELERHLSEQLFLGMTHGKTEFSWPEKGRGWLASQQRRGWTIAKFALLSPGDGLYPSATGSQEAQPSPVHGD